MSRFLSISFLITLTFAAASATAKRPLPSQLRRRNFSPDRAAAPHGFAASSP
jgi:hypothetical protein